MQKRPFLLLSLVAILLVSLACEVGLSDVPTIIDAGQKAATLAVPFETAMVSPTPFFEGLVTIKFLNLTGVDICSVAFHAAEMTLLGRTLTWNPEEFPSLSAQIIQGVSKHTYDVFAYDCNGNLLVSKETGVFADTTITLAP